MGFVYTYSAILLNFACSCPQQQPAKILNFAPEAQKNSFHLSFFIGNYVINFVLNLAIFSHKKGLNGEVRGRKFVGGRKFLGGNRPPNDAPVNNYA